ncbi:MAG TPA: hypothetical protein VL282_17410 [Tepidisphaeraceae bacterium]|jgi:nucleoside-triphosphatase THEP1|nr:hypothetical protein [Tepidisphaeraceae bacterium]
MKARENPFRAQRVLTIRYEPQGWTWPDLMRRLATMNYRGAIVGPEGSGKTTLLEDLAPHLHERGLTPKYLRLDREHTSFDAATLNAFFSGLTDRDVICFDGCEQLSERKWREFQKRAERAAGLIVTMHEAGRLPTITECSTSPKLLAEIIERLSPEYPVDVLALHARHRGNIRDALRELYDAM